uniref:Clustered mitochondria protein-like n=1 Tax=Rhizophora mucronata TaxID=61149 RepID=A0A2P2MXN2_RHIMU
MLQIMAKVMQMECQIQVNQLVPTWRQKSLKQQMQRQNQSKVTFIFIPSLLKHKVARSLSYS